MKVLHVISGDLWAGAEVQALTLLTALQKQADIQVAAAVMNEGELARRLREHGIPVSIFPEDRLNGMKILVKLRRLMLAWAPDVVHTHRSKENILGSLANVLARRAPCIRTAHGAPEHAPRGLRQLHKRLLQRFDRWCGKTLQQRIVAVSSELAHKLAGQYGAEHIVVVENGVDIESVQAAVRPVEFRARQPDAIHVGIVGRLVPVKRVDLFLQAATLLLGREPERRWHFHIFGDGPLAAELARESAKLGIAAMTTFHGHRSDVVACMAALDALVICSDHEGLPMTVLESVTVGTPVVAHATGGLVNVLQEDPNARLVREHTAVGYADAISSLIADRTMDRPTNRINVRFSSSHNAAAMRALYDALCSQGGRRDSVRDKNNQRFSR